MKRRYSKQRMENKRGVVDAMCRTQVELCERLAESEVVARKQQVESEVRTSLGLPEKPVLAEVRTECSNQTPMPQEHIEHPSIQAEIDRRVALALQSRLTRIPEKPIRRRLMRRRRMANCAAKEQVTYAPENLLPKVISFPGPRRA